MRCCRHRPEKTCVHYWDVRLVAVRLAVAPEHSGRHPMFCHRYPTGVCVVGNDGVQSLRDNVTLLFRSSKTIARGVCDCQLRGGRVLGCMAWSTDVNRFNRRQMNEPKKLSGLTKKVCGQEQVLSHHLSQMLCHRRIRRDLTHAGNLTEHGKPETLPLGKQSARSADRVAGRGGWRKRRPSCNEADRGCAIPVVATSPRAKASRLPSGLSSQESLANHLKRESRCR